MLSVCSAEQATAKFNGFNSGSVFFSMSLHLELAGFSWIFLLFHERLLGPEHSRRSLHSMASTSAGMAGAFSHFLSLSM